VGIGYAVTERVGLKSYRVYDGHKITMRHIDGLKTIKLAEEQLRGLLLNPEVKRLAEVKLGEWVRPSMTCENLEPKLKRSWRRHTVWLGFPGTKNMRRVVERLQQSAYKTVYVIVPDLECERWYRQLDQQLGRRSLWYGVEPKDGLSIFVDSAEQPCGTSVITWWVIRVEGD
jgi:hypothetical protein